MIVKRIHRPKIQHMFFLNSYSLAIIIIGAPLGNTEKKSPAASSLNFQKASFDEIAKHADSIVS